MVQHSPFKAKVLHHILDSPQAGHVGYHKTLHRAKMDFYWEGIRRDIKKLARECEVCQTCKYETVHPVGLLQPFPILSSPWLDISMDFIKDLHPSGGFTVILTVVDRLTKFGHFFLWHTPLYSK